MIRYGISEGFHDASITVMEDNDILFAAHSERYSGVKNDKRLNEELIHDALQFGKPDRIYYYERPWLKNLRRLIAGQKLKKHTIKQELRNYGIKAPISYTTHHKSHAAAGMFTSPFVNSSILCIDAIGEFTTTSIWNEKLRKKWSQNYPKSLGLFYFAPVHHMPCST